MEYIIYSQLILQHYYILNSFFLQECGLKYFSLSRGIEGHITFDSIVNTVEMNTLIKLFLHRWFSIPFDIITQCL